MYRAFRSRLPRLLAAILSVLLMVFASTGFAAPASPNVVATYPVNVSGNQQSYTYYLNMPPGYVYSSWDYVNASSNDGGGDAGTYFEPTYNALVIRTYTGGHCVSNWWSNCQNWVNGYYSATYRLWAVPAVQYPTTSASLAGNQGNDGWYRSPVTVTLSVSPDSYGTQGTYHSVNGGPSQTYSAPFTINAEGPNTLSYWSVDGNGNTETAHSLSLAIDTTPPTGTASPDRPQNANGWYNSPVTYTFSCSDNASGVASCPQSVTIANEAANQTIGGTATDKAGNSAGVTVTGINVDTTAPVTTISAPATWQNKDVPVTLAATDSLSSVAATYYTVDGGAQQSGTSLTLTAEGVHTLTYWSVDNSGNAEAAHTATIQIDKTVPTITGSADRAANAAGWYNADVKVSFTCGDALSGVASCADATTLGEGANQSVTGSAADTAGNTANATVSGVNVDKTAPVVSYTGNAGTYTADQQVSITCVATDTLSGVASNTCQPITGPAYNFNMGDNTFSATATDKAGNVGTGSTNFTVKVTYSSLCTVSQAFIAQNGYGYKGEKDEFGGKGGGIGNALCAKLDGLKVLQNGKLKPLMIDAYIHLVQAQSGKVFTKEQVAILIRLAKAL